MSEVYTAKQTTRDSIVAAVSEVPLKTNSQGQYTRAHCIQHFLRIKTIAAEQFTAIDSSKNGMEALFDNGQNELTEIKTSSKANALTIMNDYNKKIAAKSTATAGGTAVDVPDKMTHNQARQEAEDLNVAYQAVIGAKEGFAKGLTNSFGKDITDLVLMDTDGSTPKSVDAYQLYELEAIIMQNADRSSNRAARTAVAELINFQLDFRKKITINYEVMKAKVATMEAMKIPFPPSMIVTVLLANIEDVAGEDWAREFTTPMRDIRAKYDQDHEHDSASLADIIQILGVADGLRDFKVAPGPETANAANDEDMSTLHAIVMEAMAAEEEDDDSSDDESVAYAANYEKKKKEEQQRGRSSSRGRSKSRGRSESRPRERKVNDGCKHCKSYRSTRKHPNQSEEQCYFNPKWKGWRPKWVCNEMEDVVFQGKNRFSEDLSKPLKKDDRD